MVRERASLLLRETLDICKARDADPTPSFKMIFEEASSVLKKGGSTDAILGSLLAFGAMLQNTHIVSHLRELWLMAGDGRFLPANLRRHTEIPRLERSGHQESSHHPDTEHGHF
jgi:hypothetical protein